MDYFRHVHWHTANLIRWVSADLEMRYAGLVKWVFPPFPYAGPLWNNYKKLYVN